MKQLIFGALLLAVAQPGVTADASQAPSKPFAYINHVYAPHGFDSNDDTQLIVSGYLPNLCHKSPRAEAKVVGKNIQIVATTLVDEDAEYDDPNRSILDLISR